MTNLTDTTRASGLWRPAAETPDAIPSTWDGAEVGNDVRLEVWLGPRSATGAQYFRCYLLSELGRTVEPVVFGLAGAGRFPAQHWVELIAYRDQLLLEDGQAVEVPAGVERRLFAQFGAAVPAGGHLMAEYESDSRSVTAQALAAHVPPLATPLGALLYSAGCGDAFRDWYTPEGGREGGRKLQGFRAIDDAHLCIASSNDHARAQSPPPDRPASTPDSTQPSQRARSRDRHNTPSHRASHAS